MLAGSRCHLVWEVTGVGKPNGLCWGQTLVLGFPVPAAGVTEWTLGVGESEEHPAVTQGRARPASGSRLAGCTLGEQASSVQSPAQH